MLFMKKFSLLLVCAIAIVSLLQFAAPQKAAAQDYWGYGTEDGTSYWVDSDHAWTIRGGECYGLMKTVVDRKCVNLNGWTFYADEGYLWASSGNSGFAIHAEPHHCGNETVYDRPELLALYHWLRQNAHAKQSKLD